MLLKMQSNNYTKLVRKSQLSISLKATIIKNRKKILSIKFLLNFFG